MPMQASAAKTSELHAPRALQGVDRSVDSKRCGTLLRLRHRPLAMAAQHAYQRAYLPVNRLEDGTLHSW